MPIHHRSHDAADATIEINPSTRERVRRARSPSCISPQGELPPDLAYQIVHDELMLDGNARLNLATFVTTWMDPQAQRLMDESVDKNVIDKDEYPQTAELERRCVHMLAGLWHAPGAHAGVGCSTTGSSEAAMLAGLALKWRWRQRRRAAGLSVDTPNLVMGINVQVCWEKFCRYWDVEPRYVPMEGERRHLTAETAIPLCDENTIGVVAVLGSTQDGSYEPVAAIAAALEQLATGGGPDVPLHVDAASGGFIAPFIQPDLVWDFRLERVVSINTSGHKYGLVYPGVGWVIWRDRESLPEELIFNVNYLGGSMPTFALNFSRSGCERDRAVLPADPPRVRGIPACATGMPGHSDAPVLGDRQARCRSGCSPTGASCRSSRSPSNRMPATPVYDVSDALRKRGWQVPAYTLCANLEQESVLRVVVRNGFSRDLSDLLVDDLKREVGLLKHGAPAQHHADRQRFHH